MVSGKVKQICAEKLKLDHLLMSHTRINSKWIKDLNVRPKTINILEENIGSKLSDIAHSNIFFPICLLRQRKKINKWDYIRYILSNHLLFSILYLVFLPRNA